MKKILLSLILIFSFFCGCKKDDFSLKGAFIYSEVASFKDGQIAQVLGISADSDNLDKIASPSEKVQFIARLTEELNLLRQKFVLQYAVVYLNNPLEQFKIGQGVKIGQAAYREDCDMVAFEIIFSSSQAWEYYHNLGNASDNVENAEKVTLLSKKESRSLFPFAVKNSAGNVVGLDYKNLYLKAGEGLSFEQKLKETYYPQFIYCYSTYSRALKSNAKTVVAEEGMYSHVWACTEEKLTEENQTSIYYYQAHKGMWILLAVTLPTCGLVIYLVMMQVRKKRKK